MKLCLIFVILCLSCTGSWCQKKQSTTTLLEDLEEFYHLANSKPLKQLIRRYLLNDNEFQGVVRTLNSADTYFLLARLKVQPEIVAFSTWLRTQQLITGGEPFEIAPADGTTDLLNIIDPAPFWISNVNGFQGFMKELEIYAQQSMIKSHITTKIQQNGGFAQLWQRIVALRPVYERALKFPETQQLLLKLQYYGVNVNYMDKFVRTQFNWFNVNSTTIKPTTKTTTTTTTVAP